ncbi:MAG: hypothetical protein KBT87_05475 [Gammaproteobacteria bacterium]|nr:hypothetical protein [Gammaproteobacteria bacterium]MBQ0774105.1 hypothetical protein [Gammaproteobacteria bacterium]
MYRLSNVMSLSVTMLAATLLSGCATTNTELLSVSRDKESSGAFSTVFVIAISDDEEVRRTVEQSLAARITNAGAMAVISTKVMPGQLASMSKGQLRAKAEDAVKRSGADSALVALVLKDDVRENYVLPTMQQHVIPSTPLFMGYGAHVGYHYDTVILPGYFDKNREVFVQTSVFDASNGKAVWRAQSKTINPTDLTSSVSAFSNLLVNRLVKDGMITSSPAK